MNQNTLDALFRNRKPIIITFITLVVLGLVYLGYKVIYDATTLHVTATQPKNREKNHSSIIPAIFTYNRELAEETVKNITVTPHIEIFPSITEGKKLMIVPQDQWKPDTTYTITVQAKARDGKTSKPASITFTAKQLSAKNIPQKEQQQLRDANDTWESDFPIRSKLPKTTEGYRISYMNGTDEQGRMTINIDLYGIYNRPSQKAQYIADLTKHQEEAMQYLRDNGADFDKLNIVLDPDPALVQ